MGSTTNQIMCWGVPKRPRSSPGSKVHQRSARARLFTNVHPAHPWWHDMTRTLAHVCELSSASKAASRSTLSPVTDPACLQLTESMSPSCIRSQPPPNVRTTAKDRKAHKSAAHLCSRCPWRAQRLQRTAVVRPDRARQLVRAPSAGSPARSPRQLKRSWAAPGGSRPISERSPSQS